MKKRISKIFYLVLMSGVLLLLSVRCVKLQEKPLDFVSPQNFYETPSQIQAAFVSSMSRLWGYWIMYDYPNYPQFPIMDDQFYGGDMTMGSDFANQCWLRHYMAIADLNPAIKAMTDNKLGTSTTQVEKDQLMAMAKFLRGWNYFQLVRLYGAVPLVIETSDPVADKISRSPVKDVYALIESDLLFATQKLSPSQSSSSPGSPTMDVAKLLLAKVYVTMATYPLNEPSNYAKARDMAKQVIDAGNYSLVTDINKVFALENSFGPEMMWSFHNTTDVDVVEPAIWMPDEMSGWGDFKCDKRWALAYPEQPRKHAYLLLEDWNGNSWTTWNQGTPGVKKYLYDSRANIDNNVNRENVPILRFADALLIFAEAENMAGGGPSQDACNAINQIIDRANGYVENEADPKLTTALSQKEFDDAVIQQRNFELCFEYDRWFDLVRKRLLLDKTNPSYLQNVSENTYLMPIPQLDLEQNKLLTQNPGYPIPGK